MTSQDLAPQGTPLPPRFEGERLLLVVTGAPAAQGVPQWVAWARACYPHLEVRIFVTRSALKFVTKTSLQLRLGGEVVVDSWDEVDTTDHVDWARWADVALVYPATLGYISRLAAGMTDTPSLLALHCTSAVVGVAPSLPPGALQSHALGAAWKALSSVPNIVLVPPEPGLSFATGQMDGNVPPPLSSVLDRLEHRRSELALLDTPSLPVNTDSKTGHSPDQEQHKRRILTTGLLATEISPVPGEGSFDWLRRTGRDAPAPFAMAPASLAEWLEHSGGQEDATVSWALGQGDRENRIYRVSGSTSYAGSLLREGPSDALAPLLRGFGAKLATLHALSPDGPMGHGLQHGGRGIERLHMWLHGRSDSPPVAQAEALLRSEVGTSGMTRLRELTEVFRNTRHSVTHGAASLGALVPSSVGGPGSIPRATAFIGEDVCVSSPRLDLAWLAGELIELRWVRGDDDPRWQGALDAFFEGYGDDLGADWGPYAALRISLHLHDYTAYVRFDVPTIMRYAGFIRFLLDRK